MRSFHGLLSLSALCISLTVLFAGCAEAPNQELTAAKAAVQAAQDAEAEKYTPNNFTNVQKALQAAEDEIVLQNSKFALSRNYKKAIQLLANATKLANELKDEAPVKKAEITEQVEKGLTLSEKKITETRKEIKKAPRRAIDKKTRKQMLEDLDKAAEAIAQGTTAFKAGNIIDARGKIGESERIMKKINDKLSTGGGMSLM